ncbi:hypothetical protein FB567DRAFT_544843 [Paraphoma chrysanthemicola]|uniref:Uncharacterized protein n=1 Tax=Paraphoma chrysanthemicola TaxID=798071 RepID=A0A8K0W366_9PLEO|nr:hypothetical protein FB567DRAFT_544843 [Paraphoma chrysanthemicola]
MLLIRSYTDCHPQSATSSMITCSIISSPNIDVVTYFDSDMVDSLPVIPGVDVPVLSRTEGTRSSSRRLVPYQMSQLPNSSQEYRTWQANRIIPYIRAEELDGWMRTFYPITDPSDPRSSQYNGIMPYIVLPWRTNRTWDALPMIEFARRNHQHLRPDGTMMGASKIIARRLRYNGNAVEHEQNHGDLMRRVLFRPRGDTTQSILSYIESGTGYQMKSVEVRYHGHPQPGNHRAMIKIWFMDAPEVWWVNGREWNWLHPDNTVPLPVGPHKPAKYRRKQEIRLFLESAGLQHSQIRRRWTIRLAVHGKHVFGGEGV